MSNESSLIASVGFRHVIEDGITILSSGNLDSGRRKYVLEDLATLLRKATMGSTLASRSSLFVRSEERSAFEAFSLLNRYLGHGHDPDWREKLPVTKRAFDQLMKNEDMSPEERTTATALLHELLVRIKRQSGMEISDQPEDIRIFG